MDNWIFAQSPNPNSQTTSQDSQDQLTHDQLKQSHLRAATPDHALNKFQQNDPSTNSFTPNTHQFLNFDSPNNSDSNHPNNQPSINHEDPQYNSSHPAHPAHPAHQSHMSLDYLDSTQKHTPPTSGVLPSNDANSNSNNHGDWTQMPDFHDIDMNFLQHDPTNSTNHNDTRSSSQMILDSIDNSSQQHHHPASNDYYPIHNSISISPNDQSFDVVHYSNETNNSFIQNYNSPHINQQQQQQQQQHHHHQHHHHHQTTSIRPEDVFTPLVSPAVTPLESMINNNKTSNGNSNFFSPLTSPALEAKSPVKFKKSSSNSSPQDGTNIVGKKKYKTKKTPLNTPIVGPTIPGRIAKQSPIIKAKRSSSYANNIQHHQQHSSSSNSSTPNTTNQNIEYNEMTPLPEPSVESNPSSSSSMAPPSLSRRRSTKATNNNNSNSTPATPATLMNFKLESSNSPVILPSNGDIPSQISSSRRGSEDSDTKKTSHKLAEQGRRNRMNQAIVDLGTLIPEELQSTVSIPSKATTVELATRYIISLKEEVKRLKEGIDSDESVSPLETK